MSGEPILNTCPDPEFFGRSAEIGRIVAAAGADDTPGSPRGIFLIGGRWTGKTEILRRAHREIFRGQGAAPVYYQFKEGIDPWYFAEDFLKELIRQFLAFTGRDAGAYAEVSIDRLERRLSDAGDDLLAGFLRRHREAKRAGDHAALLRNALGAPRRVSSVTGTPVFLLLDDMDLAGTIALSGGGASVEKEFMDALLGGARSFAASSARGSLDGWALGCTVERVTLKGLPEEEASSMMAELARQVRVPFDSDILTLAADRLDRNPFYIKNIVWAAARKGSSLENLRDFSTLYADELTSGALSFALSSAYRFSGLNELRAARAIAGEKGPATEEELEEDLLLPEGSLKGPIEALKKAGLVEENLGTFKWAAGRVVGDFVDFIFELKVRKRNAEEVRTGVIRDCLREGYGLKGLGARGRFMEDVSRALKAFNGQNAPTFFFRSSEGGACPHGAGGETLELPQIIGSFDSSAFEKSQPGPSIIIARGFQNLKYDPGNEVVWLVGVKDSHAPVNAGDAEGFLRRTRDLRANFRTTRTVRWFLGREGFTGESLKKLSPEGVFTSDSAQLRTLLEGVLSTGRAAGGASRLIPGKEFEVVLPMSSKAELVAVRAVEEIGREMGFGAESIGEIKAALVEACINAIEHSRIRAGKVRVRVVSAEGGLVIYVENPGAEFRGREARAHGATEGELPRKRGWGIELMKGLMDEVRFEPATGGTRIVMVKYLAGKGE